MQAILEKAKAVKLLILDVDGVLTSGQLFYGSNDLDIRAFHVHDGLGIRLLQRAGVKVSVISAKKSPAVERRLKDLHIQDYYLGYEDKIPAYEKLKQTYSLTDDQIAYAGDDLPDLAILKRVGLGLTVAQAPDIMKQHVDYITKKKGGKGAVREICELILQAQGLYESVIQSYLSN